MRGSAYGWRLGLVLAVILVITVIVANMGPSTGSLIETRWGSSTTESALTADSSPTSQVRSVQSDRPAAPPTTRSRAEGLHLVPTSEEQWQAEPIDADFVQANEGSLWQAMARLPKIVPHTIECRSRTCKIEIELTPGVTLASLSKNLSGFAPYRPSAHGWILFFNPDLVEDAVE